MRFLTQLADSPARFGAQRASTSGVLRIGWSVKRVSGSHKILSREGYPDYVFAFHDNDEIGPKIMARIVRHTGLEPGDL